MKPKTFVRALPAFAVAAVLWSSVPAHASRYQRFTLTDKFTKTTKIPAKVLQTLRKDAVVNAAWLASRKKGDKSTLASWFTAQPLFVNSDQVPDLLIKPTRPELRPNKSGPFWIFLGGSTKPALRVTAFALRVLNSKVSGYRDLRSEMVRENSVFVSTILYQWNGKNYDMAFKQPLAD